MWKLLIIKKNIKILLDDQNDQSSLKLLAKTFHTKVGQISESLYPLFCEGVDSSNGVMLS